MACVLEQSYSTTETEDTQKRTERKRFLDASLNFEDVLCAGSSIYIPGDYSSP